MSTAGVSAGGGMSPDLQAILDDSARLVEELGRARKVRRLLLLGFVIFVAVTAVMFYRLYQRLSSAENFEEISRLAQAQLADDSDLYMGEVRLLVERSAPVLTEAFYVRAKQDLPEFMRKAGLERDTLVTNLQDRVSGRMEQHYRDILDRHEAVLQDELPSAKDAAVRERLGTNLGLVFDRMVKRYYGDELKTQLVALYDGWDHFPAAEASTNPGDPPLEDQLIGSLLDVLTKKLTQPPTALAEATDPPSPLPAGSAASPRPRSRRAEAEAEAESEPVEPPKPAETPTPAPAEDDPKPAEAPATADAEAKPEGEDNK